MKRAWLREHGKPGLELVDEAFVLLRTAPTGLIATYYLGSVPFVAGLLVFWADLSRHPRAPEHLGFATLAMTVLFVWMKFFHARFGARLLARLEDEPPPAWTAARTLRSIALQAVVQSTALFVLPLAAVAMLPFGWAYAFYQDVSVLDDGRLRQRELLRAARQQCALWPAQNHILLLVLSMFGFFVFLDWFSLGFFVPQLLKMFFGIESVFTRSYWVLFNTTFLAAVVALTYLTVDPLIKACYALRCFYGKSLRTGDDLRIEARRLARRAAIVAACLLFSLCVPALRAAEAAPSPAVTSAELDRSIETVLQQGKYTWRDPLPEPERESMLRGFVKSVGKLVRKTAEAIDRVIEHLVGWLRPKSPSSNAGKGGAWDFVSTTGLLYAVIIVAVCGLAFALWRAARGRRIPAMALEAAVSAAPDIEDEDTLADQLPEDDWTRLGREYWEKGEFRLALRAFYLASLASLAAGGLITIARSKSNRDYERELLRRGHAHPALPALFGENVRVFDRVWYGRHDAGPDLLAHFVDNLEKMKAAA
jgi:hypothetical protein